MKCVCGNESFYAHQRCYVDIVVDGQNNFERNLYDDLDKAIYESERPYGPYTCTECFLEYDELVDNKEDEVASRQAAYAALREED